MSNQVPPNELDAEAAVLSAMLMDAATIDEVAGLLEPTHFYADANRRICEAIFAKHQAGEKIDVVTIATWLRDQNLLGQVGGAQYLAQITDASPAIAHVADHAIIVRERWRLRQAISIGQTFAANGYAPMADPQKFLEAFELAVSDVAHIGRAVTLEPARDIVNEELKSLAQARADGSSTQGISTGLRDLDKQMGGLFATDLVVLAARPGLGKTALATTIALSVSRPVRDTYKKIVSPGYGVAFFTLEVDRGQLGMRVACHEAEIDTSRVRAGKLANDDWTKITEAAVALNDQPLYIDDTPAISLFELRARVRKLKRQIENGTAPIQSKGLFLIVVDYLQLMDGKADKGETREREVSKLSGGLKILAKQEKLCVIALSQLNRAVERDKDKRPKLSSLRESGAIEQDADKILFIYREHYYDRSYPNKFQAEIDVAKNRNGPTGTVETYFAPEPMRFHNATKADQVFDDDDQYWDR